MPFTACICLHARSVGAGAVIAIQLIPNTIKTVKVQSLKLH
jgi:hypothetical protein